MRIGFIGAGKVGVTLAKYFSVHGISISGFASRTPQSAMEAAAFTNSVYYSDMEVLVRDSDIIFITVPDGMISDVYEQIANYDLQGKYLCHCSGSMTAGEAFPDWKCKGLYAASVHPLYPVSSKTESYLTIGEAFFCLEGDEKCVLYMQTLLEQLGNKTRRISEDAKSRYHAACAIASNLVCAVLDMSLQLMTQCGFSQEEAMAALRPLAVSNVERVFAVGTKDALTGPVERNDLSTVSRHLSAVSDEKEQLLYKAASLRLIDIAQKKHIDTDYSMMRKILES
ncbi:MAG: F420-dependent NADP oxidoreductase [Oscillospiraceae bacterium]|nr:F420-dependent NADP oxidoreductase [Oscillospiraceae bacterium]